jgi:hypothetical protein
VKRTTALLAARRIRKRLVASTSKRQSSCS